MVSGPRPRRAPLNRDTAKVHAPPRGRVHLDQVRLVVRDNRDPVVLHRVAPGPVPLKTRRVPRRVHELEPLGDAEEHGPANVRKKGELEPSFRGC